MKEIVKEEIFEKKITTYRCNDFFYIKVTKENGKQTDIKLEYQDKDIFVLDGYETIKLGHCFPMYLPNKEQFYKDVQEKHYTTILEEYRGEKFDFQKYLNKLLKLETKPEDFIYCNAGSHLFFDYNFTPISYVYFHDYSGQLSQRYRKSPLWKELVSKLKTHPYIKEVKTFVVPYYNSDFEGQRGVETIQSYIPQEEYIKIWEYIKSNPSKKTSYSNYVSAEVSNIITMKQYSNENIYPLYGFEELLIEQRTNIKIEMDEPEDE